MKRSKLRPIKTVHIFLGIQEKHLRELIEEKNITIQKDFLDRDAIDSEDIDILSSCSRIASYRLETLQANQLFIKQQSEDSKQDNIKLKESLIGKAEQWISRLITIHSRIYANIKNNSDFETGECASLLLYSKAISLARMNLSCLKNNYWHIGSILREIDECIDIATYFVLKSKEPGGQKDIDEWFRLEKLPGHKKARIAIAKWEAEIFTDRTEQDNYDLLCEVYEGKSKFSHSSFQSTIEAANFNSVDSFFPETLSYGDDVDTYHLKNITEFFIKSIQRMFSTFAVNMNFVNIISREDSEELEKIDKEMYL